MALPRTFVVTLLLVGAAARAAAADPDKPAVSPDDPPAPPPQPDHLGAGTAAFEAQDYATAIKELDVAYDISKDPQLLFPIGISQQKLGHPRDAIRALARFLREGGDQIPAERKEAAVAAITELRKLVGEISIVVDGGPGQIDIDGHTEGQAPLDHSLVLEKGKHHVVVTRGPAKAERDIEVKGGDKLAIEMIPIELPDGQLTVHTSPDGAELVVDKEARGPAPWQGTLSTGPHKLMASLQNYHPLEQMVNIAGGSKAEVTLTLTPLVSPNESHWYKHWYVPVAAALVVGTIAIAVHESGQNDDLHIEFH